MKLRPYTRQWRRSTLGDDRFGAFTRQSALRLSRRGLASATLGAAIASVAGRRLGAADDAATPVAIPTPEPTVEPTATQTAVPTATATVKPSTTKTASSAAITPKIVLSPVSG